MLVTADKGTTTFLVWGGHRSKIDPNDDTIRLAFGLGTALKPRPISAALLNVIPERPDLVVPTVDTAGPTPTYAASLGVAVGDVFALRHADGSRSIFVALPDGKQQISPLVGELIRDRFDVVKNIPLVAPRLLRQSPTTAHPIDLTLYPATKPIIVDYTQLPVACVSRTGTMTRTTDVAALPVIPVPGKAKPVTVTKPGDLTVDDVYVHPGHGALFAAATAGQAGGSRPLYLVTDEGVAYPVTGDLARTYLGYAAKDVRFTAPELIDLLPKGPTLDPDTAVHFYPQTGATAGSLPSATAAAGG